MDFYFTSYTLIEFNISFIPIFLNRCSLWNTLFNIKRGKVGWSFLMPLDTLKCIQVTCQKPYSDLSLKMMFNTLPVDNWIQSLLNPCWKQNIGNLPLVKGLVAQSPVIRFLNTGSNI